MCVGQTERERDEHGVEQKPRYPFPEDFGGEPYGLWRLESLLEILKVFHLTMEFVCPDYEWLGLVEVEHTPPLK